MSKVSFICLIFSGLAGSVAVQEVVKTLEPALEDELEFLKLFKGGTYNQEVLRASTRSRNNATGNADDRTNAVASLISKPTAFRIELKDSAPVEHSFQMGDAIFSLTCANPDAANGAISEACNCCFSNFQSYKEARIW